MTMKTIYSYPISSFKTGLSFLSSCLGSCVAAVTKRALIVFFTGGALLSSVAAAHQPFNDVVVGTAKSAQLIFNDQRRADSNISIHTNQLQRQFAQNRSGKSSKNLRSKSEVVREVKQRYNAEVLKISLNSKGTAYIVRVLMPDGRVRQITVSATR